MLRLAQGVVLEEHVSGKNCEGGNRASFKFVKLPHLPDTEIFRVCGAFISPPHSWHLVGVQRLKVFWKLPCVLQWFDKNCHRVFL